MMFEEEQEKQCLNCNPICCGCKRPPEIDEDDDKRNPLSPSFDPVEVQSLRDLLGPEISADPTFNEEALEAFKDVEMFKRKKYPDDYSDDPKMVTDDEEFPELPPLIDMLYQLKERLPLTPENQDQFEEKFPEIIEEATGMDPAGGGAESTDYDVEQLYAITVDLLPNFALVVTLDIFVSVFNLSAALSFGVSVFTLFKKKVAGVRILVEITTKIVLKLLAPVLVLCFSALGAISLLIPIPNIALGANISLNIADVSASINVSVAASLGITASLDMSAEMIAAISAPAPAVSVEAGADVSIEAGEEEEDDDIPNAAGGAKIPGCEAGIKLSQQKPKPLTSMVEVSKKKEILAASSNGKVSVEKPEKIKLNIVPASGTTTRISYSVISKKLTPDSKKLLTGGIREALDRSPVQEAAVMFLFRKQKLPLDTEISLSELLLKQVGFKPDTPLEPMLLALIQMNLPQELYFDVGGVFAAMAGNEPPCPILTLKA